MTRFTTFAGSSSIMSTASSTYRSSMIAPSSESVIELIISSCSGASRFAKTSAALPFDRRRKTIGIRCVSTSVRNSATSNSFISSRRFCSAFMRCASSSPESSSNCLSCMVSKSMPSFSPICFPPFRVFYLAYTPRYSACSRLSVSIETPIAASFLTATALSISSGTGRTPHLSLPAFSAM